MQNNKPRKKLVRSNSSMMAAGPSENSRPVPEKKESAVDILRKKIANRLRAAFIREYRRHQRAVTGKDSKYGSKAMPKWDGGRDDDGFFHTDVWLDIASHLTEMQCLSPERFVQAQFVIDPRVDKKSRPPQPPMLLSEAAWNRFVEFNEDAENRLKNELKSECLVFQAHCQTVSTWFPNYEQKDLWRFVLKDLEVPLSALFRFCVAVSEDLGDVTDQFHELALQEYLQDSQGYDCAWGVYIPACLKQDGLDILNKLERTPTCR